MSLNGSPMVSPMMSSCASSPFLAPNVVCSMAFLALSQAPPALAMNSAMSTPRPRNRRAVRQERRIQVRSRPRQEPQRQRHQADHLAQGSLGGNVNTGLRVRLHAFLAFEEAWDFLELTANFNDHVASSLSHRGRYGGHNEGQAATDEKTNDHHGVGQRQIKATTVGTDGRGVSRKEGKSRQQQSRWRILPTAAVVFPMESSSSVARTSPKALISAIPPALSATGPASTAVTPTVASMPMAAMAMQ